MQNYLKETIYRYYSPVIVVKIPTNGDAEAAPLGSSKAPSIPPKGEESIFRTHKSYGTYRSYKPNGIAFQPPTFGEGLGVGQ